MTSPRQKGTSKSKQGLWGRGQSGLICRALKTFESNQREPPRVCVVPCHPVRGCTPVLVPAWLPCPWSCPVSPTMGCSPDCFWRSSGTVSPCRRPKLADGLVLAGGQHGVEPRLHQGRACNSRPLRLPAPSSLEPTTRSFLWSRLPLMSFPTMTQGLAFWCQ
jgi:hypothetical protein